MAHTAHEKARRLLAGAMIITLSALVFACAGTPSRVETTVPLPPIEQLEGIVRSGLPVTMGLPTPCDESSSGQTTYTLRCGSAADVYTFVVNMATLTASPADQLTATAIQNTRLADCMSLKLCSGN